MPVISFPRVFANLTTGQATYLDDNFNAINSWLLGGNIDSTMLNLPNVNANIAPSHVTADGNPRIASTTPGANVIPVGDSAGQIAAGFLPSGFTAGNLVFDSIAQGITYPTTTVTINPPLTGVVHGGYRFEFCIVNAGSGNPTFRIFYNNDTTTTNYDIAGNGSVVLPNLNANDAYVCYTAVAIGARMVLSGFLTLTPSGANVIVNSVYQASLVNSTNVMLGSTAAIHTYRTAITDLTRIDIVSSLTNNIVAGSRFRLWRMI